MVIRLRWSGLSGVGDQPDLDAALGGEQGRVHVGDLVLDDVGEDALERGQLEHLDVELGDLAADLDVDLLGDLAGERGEDPAELLHQRDAGPHVLGDHPALHVDRVRHQLAGQREPHRPGDRDAGLLLRLVGGGAEVRGGDDVLELEERRVGARLLGEDVEPGGGDPAGLEGVVQRLLVDDAAARGVDQHQAGPGDARTRRRRSGPTVSGVLGRCTLMKSDSAISSSRLTMRTPIWAARPACT